MPSEVGRLIVGGVETSAPLGVPVRTFADSEIVRFPAKGQRSEVTEIVIHETVSTSVDATVATLNRRGLGVQLILGPDGTLYQHGDLLADVQSHAAKHNRTSFGVEVVNPYDPSLLGAKGLPWERVIDAPWSWKGRYVLPTPAQAEAVASLIRWATSMPAPGINIPRRWPGLRSGRFQFGPFEEADKPLPGILAHQYFGHSDGAWLVLYSWLRLEAGMKPSLAYDEAARRATGAKGSVSVRDLFPSSAAV